MKKKSLYFWGATFISAVAFSFASCSQEDDFIIDSGLDIDSQVPLTRADGGDRPNQIPKVDDQCGPYAATKVAMNKGVEQETGQKNKDGSPKKAKVGSCNYPASRYYQEFNNTHESRTWDYCDKRGNKIESGPLAGTYKGASDHMYPSALLAIGKETGVLEGGYEYFETYEELVSRLSSSSFKEKHPAGTYIIHNPRARGGQGHFSVGMGMTKNGKVKTEDALGYPKYSKDDDAKPGDEKTGWTVLY